MTRWLAVALAYLMLAGGVAAQDSRITVNGVALTQQQIAEMTRLYGQLHPGDFWYDPVSGLWGQWGGPSIGQIHPGLEIGGPLPPNASGGGTGTYFNGREIHPQEYAYLYRLYGQVLPGRFWLGPNFVGGYEGGPPLFDIRRQLATVTGRGGGAGYNRNTIGGGLMSDGGCAGYLHPSGASVMTGSC